LGVIDYPKDLLEFRDQFHSEGACRDYLLRLRWPEGWRCPKCGGQQFWMMKRGVLCCQSCQQYVSVTAGTLFADTHKPLRLWFEAMWHETNQKYGASALGMQRILGFGSYRTAWNWLHKLRRAMVRPGRDRLGGTVEVDEIFIGGERPGKRGRGAAGKSLVLIAAQKANKGIGRIRLARVVNASGEHLEPVVVQAVESGSTVCTDAWGGYNGLKALGYEHTIIRPTPALGVNLLPLVNRVASLLKRWLLGTHQGSVRPSHLDYYLDEFTFRFNRRTSGSRGLLFYRLVDQAVHLSPILTRELKGTSTVPATK
jgi:transposase-like protein